MIADCTQVIYAAETTQFDGKSTNLLQRVREAAKKFLFFRGPITKMGGGQGPAPKKIKLFYFIFLSGRSVKKNFFHGFPKG